MLANASPSDKLSKRLQAIFAQASISRRDMLGAMIGQQVLIKQQLSHILLFEFINCK